MTVTTQTPSIHIFSDADLDSLYVKAVKTIARTGVEIKKGGTRIKEIFPAVFVLEDPKIGILCVEHRPYNPAFLVAETVWNLVGDSTDWLVKYNHQYSKFFAGGELRSGYGYRLLHWDGDGEDQINQIDLLVRRLRDEPASQHASATIFHPRYDLANPPFVPCITRLQFKIRDGKLHMSAYLRAQDVWLGFPYDVHLLLSIFQFVALRLNLPLGRYYHYCDVLRLYEKDFEAAEMPLHGSLSSRSRKIDFTGLGEDVVERLLTYRDCLSEFPTLDDHFIEEQPQYWQDCLRICCAYRAARSGDYALARDQVERVDNILRDQFWIWASKFSPLLV